MFPGNGWPVAGFLTVRGFSPEGGRSQALKSPLCWAAVGQVTFDEDGLLMRR
jgi:hypothetical protein